MNRASVIFLNGAPSSGKTTLARALQAQSSRPAFYQSYDQFKSSLPKQFWTTQRVHGVAAIMLKSYLQMLEAVANNGLAVIAESMMLPETRKLYATLLDRFDVSIVGVRCPLTVTQDRENQRTDRYFGPIDLDVAEFHTVHDNEYAVEVDTSTQTANEAIQRIIAALPEWT